MTNKHERRHTFRYSKVIEVSQLIIVIVKVYILFRVLNIASFALCFLGICIHRVKWQKEEFKREVQDEGNSGSAELGCS